MNFDPFKASFYLIALVVALHGLVILLGYIGCIVWFNPAEGSFECDKSGRLAEMMTAAMAAAMMFVGGFMRGRKNDDQPK